MGGCAAVKAGLQRGCNDPKRKLALGTTNHLYSVAAITNLAGQVVERYSYNAYGVRTVRNPANVVIAKSAVGNDRGFTGYKFDCESGNYLARTRVFSPKFGRFLNRNGWGSSLFYSDSVWSYQFVFIVDSSSKRRINEVLSSANGSYIQGRMGLYDYAFNNPANFLEPYSSGEESDNDGFQFRILVIGFRGSYSQNFGSAGIVSGYAEVKLYNSFLQLATDPIPNPEINAGGDWSATNGVFSGALGLYGQTKPFEGVNSANAFLQGAYNLRRLGMAGTWVGVEGTATCQDSGGGKVDFKLAPVVELAF